MKDMEWSRQLLVEIQKFLSTVEHTNEDTRYDPDQEHLVKSIMQITRSEGKTSINEDFELPYVHPMITIQKWNKELKEIIEDLLGQAC